MSLIERVQQEIMQAMKAKETLRLDVLRGMKTALKNKEIELVRPLNPSEEVQVVRTLVKQRRDSIEQFARGGRQDLVEREEAEARILGAYLPAAVDVEEIRRVVEETIGELQTAGTKDVGRVMKTVMAKLAGRNVDGRAVNEMVRARLAGG